MLTVFLDRDDVAKREAIADQAIALTPSAFAAASALRINVHSSLDIFSDRDHARCAVAARAAVRQFDRALDGKFSSPSVLVAGRQAAWYVANITQRIARTLRGQRLHVRHQSGSWREVGGHAGAIDALFPRILDFGLAHRLRGRRPAFATLYNWFSAVGARRSRSSARWIMTPAGLKLGFNEAFANAGLRVGRIALTTGTRQDYHELVRALLGRTNRFLVAPVDKGDGEYSDMMAALEQAGSGFADPLVRQGWEIYLPYLQQNLLGMLGLAREGARLMNAADAVGAASYETNGWAGAALFEAARRAGRKAITVNHNSHALTGRATADSVIERLYRQRNSFELSTAMLHWTPGDVEMAKRVAAEVGSGPRTLPCRLGYPGRSNVNSRFKVLHAANYQNWSDFFPWIAETSDEFVNGIRILSQAAADIPNLDLVIRVRPKPEVDADVVRNCIAGAPNVSVCSTEEDFLEQLAGSDLLVSYFSTTVAQALQLGRPVLLWGQTKRFHQLPARVMPPLPGDRGAVYAVNEAEQLRPMLMALRDQHGGRPMTDAELAPYRFGSNVPDAVGAARTVIAEGDASGHA